MRSLFKPHYNTSEEWRARARECNSCNRQSSTFLREVSRLVSSRSVIRHSAATTAAAAAATARSFHAFASASSLPSFPASIVVPRARCPRGGCVAEGGINWRAARSLMISSLSRRRSSFGNRPCVYLLYGRIYVHTYRLTTRY